jgi:hypothetical protein
LDNGNESTQAPSFGDQELPQELYSVTCPIDRIRTCPGGTMEIR